MKKRTPYLFGILLAVFAFGLARIFQLRLNSGDIFPAYSSERSDDVGLAALYRALSRLPHLQVSRWIRSLPELEQEPSQTVILAGMPFVRGTAMSSEDADWLMQTARSGTRIVIAFAPPESSLNPQKKPDTSEKKNAVKKNDEKKKEENKSEDLTHKLDPISLEKTLGVQVKVRMILDHAPPAVASSNNIDGLNMPQAAEWMNEIYFEPENNSLWKTICRRGGSPVLIERKVGHGSIVLAGDSYFLTNESVARHEATPLITWIVGDSLHIVFDESHLGLREETSIAALARRYGLGGAMLLLLGLVALYIWRRTAVFVPVIAQDSDSILEIDHTAGLESLLRRSVPAGELIDTCLAEFKPPRASDRARVVAALEKADPYPVKKYNAAAHSLRIKT